MLRDIAGNAPAWFDGNAHAAVFTGFKSQALAQSQSGTGGYQQLRLDDTSGQGRAQAATTQHASTWHRSASPGLRPHAIRAAAGHRCLHPVQIELAGAWGLCAAGDQ